MTATLSFTIEGRSASDVAMALEEEYVPEPSVYALHRSFLDSIRLWGRVHELSLIMEHKILCLLAEPPLFFRGLISDLMMGGDLILKGKISFLPERIKRLGEVKRLYEEAARSGRAQDAPLQPEVER